MGRKVLKKIIYYVGVRFASPVCISSGDDDTTDKDVLTDYDGTPFIPGSSLAGSMRNYIGYGKSEKCIFGFHKEETDGQMSSLFVSDLVFSGDVKTVVRDSVALSEGKTAITGAKFDMEAVDTGAEGDFILELVIREKDDETDMLRQLASALGGFESREIRLGTKKTRGYGEMEITSIRKREFNAGNILDGYPDAFDIGKACEGLADIKDDFLPDADGGNYVHIEVPLALTGGISIRQYASRKGEPDFVHITAAGDPVVPGTSFAGAIRHRIQEILQIAGVNNSEGVLSVMFGFVDGDQAHRSNVVFGESRIDGAEPLTMTRTGISRFESSAKNHGLYQERAYVGGRLTLTADIRKNTDAGWMAGLLLLAVKDLAKGYLPVGGQTAAGRGIFETDREKLPDGYALLDGKVINEENEMDYFGKILNEIGRAVPCRI